ncbi:hypothetical protein D3C71_2231200 [compost metagenome]
MIVDDEAGFSAARLADMADKRAVYRDTARLLSLAVISSELGRFLQGSIAEFLTSDDDM